VAPATRRSRHAGETTSAADKLKTRKKSLLRIIPRRKKSRMPEAAARVPVLFEIDEPSLPLHRLGGVRRKDLCQFGQVFGLQGTGGGVIPTGGEDSGADDGVADGAADGAADGSRIVGGPIRQHHFERRIPLQRRARRRGPGSVTGQLGDSTAPIRACQYPSVATDSGSAANICCMTCADHGTAADGPSAWERMHQRNTPSNSDAAAITG
jgi:hypothetical protein